MRAINNNDVMVAIEYIKGNLTIQEARPLIGLPDKSMTAYTTLLRAIKKGYERRLIDIVITE